MADDTCTYDACERPREIRTWCARHYGVLYRTKALPVRQAKILDVDEAARTCTCLVHGPGSRLRVRARPGGTYFACRKCERGERSYRPETRRRIAYGLSDAQFQVMMEDQHGRCFLCGDEMDVPYVDHDHGTGVVRGILCRRCNVGLGFFRDDVDVMARAITYLKC